MSYLLSNNPDMLSDSVVENLFICGDNISLFYFICAVVSFLAVWLTWNVGLHSDETKEEVAEDSNSSLNGNFSTLERRALTKSFENSLSSEDVEKENEIQRKQLMDILDLMRQDEKFQSTTFEELQEQLKLYRE